MKYAHGEADISRTALFSPVLVPITDHSITLRAFVAPGRPQTGVFVTIEEDFFAHNAGHEY
jgi:hypothetical protein